MLTPMSGMFNPVQQQAMNQPEMYGVRVRVRWLDAYSCIVANALQYGSKPNLRGAWCLSQCHESWQ